MKAGGKLFYKAGQLIFSSKWGDAMEATSEQRREYQEGVARKNMKSNAI